MPPIDLLVSERFPRSSKYNPDWIIASVSGGANSLWLIEWLASAMDLRPGMRVLDLGCGRAASSIFLHREYGVEVWAADLWFSPDENYWRIRDAGLDQSIFPLRVDARSLPFAPEYFDAVVCIDSFHYFATDDHYLSYLARFVRPGGIVALVGAGLVQDVDTDLPVHLREWWSQDLWSLHSAAWWKRHWDRTGILEGIMSDTMDDGWKAWLDWIRVIASDNQSEIDAIEADAGRHFGYIRLFGRRRHDLKLDPSLSEMRVPPQYTKKPLLRDDE